MKMEELDKLRVLYKLKRVERANSVEERKESPAEHSWSCLMLADYFLSLGRSRLDKLKIYELLMYHDLVEIETGDINLLDGDKRTNKKEKEFQAMEKIKEKIPAKMKEKFVLLFKEFEEGKTLEARFAKAIDALDAEIHEMDYKEDWKGWTEEFLRKSKEKYFEGFPEIKKMFEETIKHCRKEGYFGQ